MSGLLNMNEEYKKELDHVNNRIEEITAKVKEKKFWEGKINEQ